MNLDVTYLSLTNLDVTSLDAVKKCDFDEYEHCRLEKVVSMTVCFHGMFSRECNSLHEFVIVV